MKKHGMSQRLQIEKSAIQNHLPNFTQHVVEGLSLPQKQLSPMYLYDASGSQLFEKICELPEYYLTRIEHSILEKHANAIASYSDGRMALVELGSGSSAKTRLLIEALIAQQNHLHYIPVDISETILVSSARKLLEEYPELRVTAHIGEYHDAIHEIANQEIEQKMAIFLGSNIGNFEPPAAGDFLEKIRRWLQKGDFMLLSTDMQKDAGILEAAYNDEQGITAEFNMNILKRMNRELGANFDLEQFSHISFYNRERGRIELHLRSQIDQNVYFEQLYTSFDFKRGETIHTENSYKYTKEMIAGLCNRCGFRWIEQWTDDREFFSVNLFSAA